ncbi:hypothetical protein [Cupriavidus sp. L7L]|uniref:hypothetical protein n=1 Tax=Cupriavidus sp. L7L TaxID=2546443 RepID=UPI001A9DA8DB|nr:hypothetical protein [Cupriavidus sp. L7L]
MKSHQLNPLDRCAVAIIELENDCASHVGSPSLCYRYDTPMKGGVPGFLTASFNTKAVKDGLGLRWSFMGPMETIDLNAPGGLRDYCGRYGPLYLDIARQATPRQWTDALIGKLEAERLVELPSHLRDARQAWRDQRLMQLVAHKRSASTEYAND